MKKIAILFFVGMIANAVNAELRLPAIFNDNMVLQRQMPIPVWGWGKPGAAVSVTLNNATRESKIAENGSWRVNLPPCEAKSKESTMTISSESEKITIKGVLIGEVWFCSGQSNMAMRLVSAQNATEEIKNADFPNIRAFRVTVRLSEEAEKDTEGVWVKSSTGNKGRQFYATAYFFARYLHKKLNLPVGIIQCANGGTMIESWLPPVAVKANPKLAYIAEEYQNDLDRLPNRRKRYEKALAELKKKKELNPKLKLRTPQQPRGTKGQRDTPPGGLFNGMVHPLIPYAIRGFLWYQGEKNSRKMPDCARYTEPLVALAASWRSLWKEGDIPFLFVQLPNLAKHPWNKIETWAVTRNSQRKALLRIPNSAMAITIDIGDPNDVHPKNKQDVGKRLALLALNKCYGEKIPCSGPLPVNALLKNGQVEISFDHVYEGLICEGPELTGFELAGEDGQFTPAKAVLHENKVILTNFGPKKPRKVRYAWKNDPVPCLVNSAKLPASPFELDIIMEKK